MRVPFHVISQSPAIYASVAGRFLPWVLAAAREARFGQPATFLLMVWWDGVAELPILATQHARAICRFPEMRLIYLCNTQEEHLAFLSQGMAAIFCNHNAFVDEFVFKPREGQMLRWRAVLNAALAPYKRLQLADEVDDLVIVAYEPKGRTTYSLAMQKRLEKKSWANRRGDAFTWLDSNEVGDVLRSAAVGLCLSEREGAMYASAEYLLCGLPVVTTPSVGGRDVFFTKDTSVVAEPHPTAIASAVSSALARAAPAQSVRDCTLSLIQPHRDRYNALLRDLYATSRSDAADTRFIGAYCQRLYRWCELTDVRADCAA